MSLNFVFYQLFKPAAFLTPDGRHQWQLVMTGTTLRECLDACKEAKLTKFAITVSVAIMSTDVLQSSVDLTNLETSGEG